MSLSSGARLGPYEIQAAIGAGGMGEVYKAKDTRLDRSVAIKILPAEVSADPDRRARFEREAKTIAGLTHPHICTLYDVGEHNPSTDSTGSPQTGSGQAALYLVMEHLTGDTLAQRLEKGPLPLEQALTVATEIADALSAAHRQGVIHRDLKPGNVMLTKTGAKLLDFGLAKLKAHGEHPAAASLASAPTRTAPLTSEGAIVGTLHYMAPEQVEGKPADARTDLWALGAILYEMLTGKRAFEGTSAASLIGHIMNTEPPALATLQPLTPPALDRLVRRCLAKSPDDRPDTAHDVADGLRWMREGSGVQLRRRTTVPTLLWVAGGLLLFAAGSGVMWWLRPSPQLAGLALSVSPAEELNAGGVALSPFRLTPGGTGTVFAWRSDGQALVFVGRQGGVQRLYVRRLDTAEARPLPNTEGAQVPSVSADGQWVAFWADGAIRKVPLAGGPVMGLVSGMVRPAPRGLVWDSRGRLFFGGGDGRIWAISADGKSEPVTTVGEAELAHTLPSLLPNGRALLYTVRKREWSWGDEEVVAQPLPTGERKILLKDAADARYVPTGHLVFLRWGQLLAVAFDAERLEVHGTPLPVLEPVAQALAEWDYGDVTGAGQFAVAATGTLAWVPGPGVPYPESVLVTVDRRGHISPLPAPMRRYGGPVRLSPDGHRLAVNIQTPTECGVWVYDLGRETLTLLAGGGEAGWVIWSPDGRRLLFNWLTDGRRALAAQPADGTAPPQVLVPGLLRPSSFTPDGRQVACLRGGDIEMVTMENGKARVEPVNHTPEAEGYPELSPDGRWLAFASDVSGRNEVYVRRFPGDGPTELVSVEGGRSPAWHPSGGELFYVSPADAVGQRRMMVVDFTPGSPPHIGRPRPLFEFDNRAVTLLCGPVRCYDVAADGQRFYGVQMPTLPPPPVVTHINLIPNWFEELKAKLPAGQ